MTNKLMWADNHSKHSYGVDLIPVAIYFSFDLLLLTTLEKTVIHSTFRTSFWVYILPLNGSFAVLFRGGIPLRVLWFALQLSLKTSRHLWKLGAFNISWHTRENHLAIPLNIQTAAARRQAHFKLHSLRKREREQSIAASATRCVLTFKWTTGLLTEPGIMPRSLWCRAFTLTHTHANTLCPQWPSAARTEMRPGQGAMVCMCLSICVCVWTCLFCCYRYTVVWIQC